MFDVRLRIFASVALVASAMVSSFVSASPILVDRGLPTANLNNIAGANRSNVIWVFGGYTPTDYFLVGDTFTNTTGTAWDIDTITMWTTNDNTPWTPTFTLWGAVSGDTPVAVATTGTSTPVTYSDLTTYQGAGVTYYNMFQVDFAVNLTLAAGATYEFYLDGTGGPYTVPSAHASNAALSGSSQAGSDDLMLYGQVVSGLFAGAGTWTSLNDGWDKASDLNVQVRGNVVPEPASLALMGVALLGLAAARRNQA